MASRMSNAASDSDARMTIEIPNSQPMVALLGSNDEYLRLIENAFPSVSVLVRGNEIRLDGPAEESAIIDSLIAEMLAMLRTGQALSTESVERSIGMLRSGSRPLSSLGHFCRRAFPSDATPDRGRRNTHLAVFFLERPVSRVELFAPLGASECARRLG